MAAAAAAAQNLSQLVRDTCERKVQEVKQEVCRCAIVRRICSTKSFLLGFAVSPGRCLNGFLRPRNKPLISDGYAVPPFLIRLLPA